MALDSISLTGLGVEDPQVASGIQWFLDHQDDDGLWPTGYGKGRRAESARRWVGLRACVILKRILA
jgi:hypothetical protein